MAPKSPNYERFLDIWITLGLVLLAAVLYVPYIGTSPLWDPWEAHYSQVAMEMIWKDSWWMPWYRESSRSFWSKPIFTFWLMVSSLKTFRIQQLGDITQAEFYLRLPIALMGATGIGFFYFFIRKLWDRRVGLLAALILATCPQYFLLSRQVMVDIPFMVLALCALGFLALGIFGQGEEEDQAARTRGAFAMLGVAGAFIAFQLLEVLYWNSTLNQTMLETWKQSSYHWSAIAAFFLVWSVVRYFVGNPQTRAFYLFYFFSGLVYLAKGLLSIVLPGGILFFYIVLAGDWDLLRRMRLVYVSERISLRASIWIAVLSGSFAIFIIAYPMFQNTSLVALFNSLWTQKIQFARGGESFVYYPFAWLKALFGYLDAYILVPFAKLAPAGSKSLNPTYQVRFLIVIGLLLLVWILGLSGKNKRTRFFIPLGLTLLFWELVTHAGTYRFGLRIPLGKYIFKAPAISINVALLTAIILLAIPLIKRVNLGFRLGTTLGGGIVVYYVLAKVQLSAGLKSTLSNLFYQNSNVWTVFVLALLAAIYALLTAEDPENPSATPLQSAQGEYLKAFFFPGVLLFLVIAGTWTYYMNLHHGLPFMREWFVYHHFSRVAGVIEKPNDSFDLYIKQIGFGLFPWTALVPIALFRFMQWSWRDFTNRLGLRNYFFFCCFFFPYFFFTFSSTKFHHYIFPVVPFLALIVAVWVSRLFLENGVTKERIGLAISLLFFVLLAKDLMTNYKPLHQLFTYYYTRETPPDVYPRNFFSVVFALIGLGLFVSLLSRRMRAAHFALIYVPVTIFVLFVNVRIMPAVGENYSFKSVFDRYRQLDKHKEKEARNKKSIRKGMTVRQQLSILHRGKTPFGEYSNWDERSTSFYTKNFSTYLGRAGTAKDFIRRHRRVYIMVKRNEIPMLRRLAATVGKKIYIVARPHFEMWLVSTQPAAGARSKRDITLTARPNLKGSHWTRINVNFNNKIRLIGVWQNKPKGYKRGDKVELRFLYEVNARMRRNWRVFIHADPVQWTRNRLNWDHEMAEGLYPTTEWKRGEYVQDIVIRKIPRNFPENYHSLSIYTGLWLGSDRLPVLSSQGAYHDGQNRIRALVLKLLPN
ncbi:MAG: glycosyltransferase family 39 protein [Myxococcales bacterium]|nr:glycosyltransferase family 39 protein [Myxococcales bacterium]MCB9644135.1 glycosyltransferase family 39 protein [Myxococcales bacterium]